jgi:hypothetical protein
MYPPKVQRILEASDEAVLYSVNWVGGDDELDSVLAGNASNSPGVIGTLPIRPEDRLSIVAWLYDGATRPAGGSRCVQPHHAFLFRRNEGKVAIAVCFECGTLGMRGARTLRADLRWDPAFRDYLKASLNAAGIQDLSSDLRAY